MELSMLANLLNLASQRADTVTNLAPVHFEFGLAGSTSPDPAAQPRQILPMACQPGQSIIELSQFDLQLAFFASGSTRKDIQNETRAIHDFGFEHFLEILFLT